MIYHKNLTRKDLLKYGWKKLLMMAASEFSRADSISNNGGGKEYESCFLRAKELLAVLETDRSIPAQSGLKLNKFIKMTIAPSNIRAKTIYHKAMALAAS
jgi:hypothetical protein